jgi:hypothetical protein
LWQFIKAILYDKRVPQITTDVIHQHGTALSLKTSDSGIVDDDFEDDDELRLTTPRGLS